MRFILPIVLAVLFVGCRTNESPERQVNDLEITAQVKSKLASDLSVSTVTNISVNSTNGIVTLSGMVDSAQLKARAAALASSVPKVVKVVDNLQVAPKSGGVRPLLHLEAEADVVEDHMGGVLLLIKTPLCRLP